MEVKRSSSVSNGLTNEHRSNSSKKTGKHDISAASSSDASDPPKQRKHSFLSWLQKTFTNTKTSHSRSKRSPPRQRAVTILGTSYLTATSPPNSMASGEPVRKRSSTVGSTQSTKSRRPRTKTVIESTDAEAQQPRSVLQFAFGS